MAEVKLMKGNEVLAEAAIRCGCDAYYGYPITLQYDHSCFLPRFA